jgi:hypothetical protein
VLNDLVRHSLERAFNFVTRQELAFRQKRQIARRRLAFIRTAHITPVVRTSRDSLHDFSALTLAFLLARGGAPGFIEDVQATLTGEGALRGALIVNI